MKIIPYGKQNITQEDINAVLEVLKSDYLTQGPKIQEFEKEFAKYVGSKYAVSVSNGTAALHLCNIALEVKKGDKVITTPITFTASANSVLYCEGEVIFSDIDPDTYLLDIHKVRELLEKSPKGTFKGIIPVDFAGRSVNLEEFRKLADEYGLWIIEDSCHAPGGFFKDSMGVEQNCGNGNFADLSIFSFHPVKHITTGEGGMITTNREDLYKKLLILRTHGITKNENEFLNSSSFASGINNQILNYPGWYMEMQTLGFNYRLTDFQAALGISQLTRANEGLSKRKNIALNYYNAFKNKSYIKGQSGYLEGHAYHLYVIEAERRIELYNFLKEKNILAQIHYIPVHKQPYYVSLYEEQIFQYAEEYYKHCLSIPMYPSLSSKDQEIIIFTINQFYEKNHE